MAAAITVHCSVEDTGLRFQFPDGSVERAAKQLLIRSGILQQSYDVSSGSEFTVVAPEGFVQSWLQLVHNSGSLPDNSVLLCLKAADFFADEDAVETACKLLARPLVRQSEAEADAETTNDGVLQLTQALEELPQGLSVRVLRTSPADLGNHLAVLPAKHHLLAVQAAFPSAFTNAHLDLDMHEYSLSTATATLRLLESSQQSGQCAQLHSASLKAVPLLTTSQTTTEFLKLLMSAVVARVASLAISVEIYDKPGFSELLASIEADNRLEVLKITGPFERTMSGLDFSCGNMFRCAGSAESLKSVCLRPGGLHMPQQHLPRCCFDDESLITDNLSPLSLLTDLTLFYAYPNVNDQLQFLSRLTALQRLQVSIPGNFLGFLRRGWTPEQAPDAGLCLCMPDLEALTIRQHGFREQPVEAEVLKYVNSIVAPLLTKSKKLQRLDMSECRLNDACIDAIGTALAHSPCSLLQSLSLRVPAASTKLVGLLDGVMSYAALTSLALDAFDHHPVSRCADITAPLVAMRSLAHLSLSYFKIIGRCTGNLPVFSGFRNLTSLNLYETMGGTETLGHQQALRVGLSCLTGLQELQCCFTREGKDMIAPLATLTALTLLRVDLQDDSEEHRLGVLASIAKLKTLQHLDLTWDYDSFNVDVAGAFGVAIQSLSGLRHLQLTFSNSHDGGVLPVLGSGLQHLSGLQSLALCDCNVDGSFTSVQPLAAAMAEMTGLTKLRLESLTLNPTVLRVLRSSLSSLKRLHTLEVVNVDLRDESTCQALRDLWGGVASLRSVGETVHAQMEPPAARALMQCWSEDEPARFGDLGFACKAVLAEDGDANVQRKAARRFMVM